MLMGCLPCLPAMYSPVRMAFHISQLLTRLRPPLLPAPSSSSGLGMGLTPLLPARTSGGPALAARLCMLGPTPAPGLPTLPVIQATVSMAWGRHSPLLMRAGAPAVWIRAGLVVAYS